MASKSFIVFGIFSTALLVLLIRGFVKTVPDVSLENIGGARTGNAGGPQLKELQEISQALVKQRNEMVEKLNQKQQKLGQIACEKLGSSKQAPTSETGGWCMQSSKENSGHHMTDKRLATALAEFFKGKSVASFGDGPGRYKQLLLDSGKVKGYDAYDGAPYTDTTSEGRVKFLDLTLAQYGLPLYDWVMSLEVAEHIPQQFESVYIDNIVRHAREGVVISWAVPGQGGYKHINNRPLDYVVKLFDGLGFSHDEKASAELKKTATLWWLQKNTNVFRRRDYATFDKEGQYLI